MRGGEHVYFCWLCCFCPVSCNPLVPCVVLKISLTSERPRHRYPFRTQHCWLCSSGAPPLSCALSLLGAIRVRCRCRRLEGVFYSQLNLLPQSICPVVRDLFLWYVALPQPTGPERAPPTDVIETNHVAPSLINVLRQGGQVFPSCIRRLQHLAKHHTPPEGSVVIPEMLLEHRMYVVEAVGAGVSVLCEHWWGSRWRWGWWWHRKTRLVGQTPTPKWLRKMVAG